MKVEFHKKFLKDLDKIKTESNKEQILQIIKTIEDSKTIKTIPGIKKLSGFKDAYRIRIRSLRIGFFLEEDTVLLARVARRKDIYKLFP